MKRAESNPSYQTIERRELRNHSTASEASLWKILKNSQVGGYKFRRQHGIGPYILDFYCPALRLDIELDGSAHDAPMADKHDEIRTKFLEEQGITVMRFRNDIVWKFPNAIIEEILEFAKTRIPRPY
jgi:very-short-patch-repair endonuclease